MREVRVIISPDGKTSSSDFSGFQGPSCLDEAERLRQILARRFGIQSQQTNFVAKPELAQSHQQQRTREAQSHE